LLHQPVPHVVVPDLEQKGQVAWIGLLSEARRIRGHVEIKIAIVPRADELSTRLQVSDCYLPVGRWSVPGEFITGHSRDMRQPIMRHVAAREGASPSEQQESADGDNPRIHNSIPNGDKPVLEGAARLAPVPLKE
jgi:hypothetical protein